MQEIVVPVLKFTNIRKESKRAQEVKKVDVELTSTSRKIPNNPFVLNFFQTEKTGPKSLPRTLRIALCDFSGGQEKVVSTEELLKADRDSENAQERTFSIRFKLKVGVPNGEYHLRLTDDETKMPYQTIPFEVKLGIPTFDDFGS